MVGYAHRGGFTMPEPGFGEQGPFHQRIDPRTGLVRAPWWLKATAIVILLAGIGLSVLAAAAGLVVLAVGVVVLLVLIPVFFLVSLMRSIADRVTGRHKGNGGSTDGRENVRVLGRDEP